MVDGNKCTPGTYGSFTHSFTRLFCIVYTVTALLDLPYICVHHDNVVYLLYFPIGLQTCLTCTGNL